MPELDFALGLGCLMYWNSGLVPELVVRNLTASLAFWRDLLGFATAYDRPEQGFAYLHREGAEVMLDQHDPQAPDWLTGPLDYPLGRGINFQIAVAALDPILHRLDCAGWPLFIPVEVRWYRAGSVETGQRQVLIQDPDGYLVRLAESLGQRDIGAEPPPQ